MNKTAILLFLGSLFIATASAQWQTTSFALKGGWNTIYLHGDATHATPDVLFPNSGDTAKIEQVWRWNPNPSQVQFTSDPLIPSAGTPEWSVWHRGNPTSSTLSVLTGQTAYLVYCSGTSADNYSVQIKNRPQPPSSTWVRSGANLLGFPSSDAGGSYPTVSNYFATFPAAIAANAKIFKYVGGELGPVNPLQIFSPSFEALDRNQAYWFEAEVTGNFYAPIEVAPSNPAGLEFGRTGSVLAVRIRNRTSAAVTMTITPTPSESAPAGQLGVTHTTVPLKYEGTALSTAINVVVGPQSSIEVEFELDRATMTTTSTDIYASFLKFTDSGNLMDVLIPVSAQPASMAGLWVGDVLVTDVNQNEISVRALAKINGEAVTEVALFGPGGRGYFAPPSVTIAAPPSGITATAIAKIENGVVTGFEVTDPGSGYTSAPAVSVDPPRLGGSSTLRSFPLRYILHIDDSGTERLLSQVFVGILDASGELGNCTNESDLKTSELGSAYRLVAAHMPLDLSLSAGAGSVALGATLERSINLPYNAKTNPFVHQYHPDHDNKNPRGEPVGAGEESYTVNRVVSFNFATTAPVGTSSIGWGATVLGGIYTEDLVGINKQTLSTSGTFTFRRVNEIGSITAP